ncbi:DUF1960-domain-containing protein [Cyathus striatus]|nr:DUF1960-domain-containing protein [Cyathus striatus]
MTKALTKVIYKPDSQSTDEYMIIVNVDEYKKWKAGGISIPLSEVVDSFSVFFSNQGAQGILGKPSNQQLDTVFGSHKDVDVVEFILKEGREQASDAIKTSTFGATNAAKGSMTIDTRGGRTPAELAGRFSN